MTTTVGLTRNGPQHAHYDCYANEIIVKLLCRSSVTRVCESEKKLKTRNGNYIL